MFSHTTRLIRYKVRFFTAHFGRVTGVKVKHKVTQSRYFTLDIITRGRVNHFFTGGLNDFTRARTFAIPTRRGRVTRVVSKHFLFEHSTRRGIRTILVFGRFTGFLSVGHDQGLFNNFYRYRAGHNRRFLVMTGTGYVSRRFAVNTHINSFKRFFGGFFYLLYHLARL